MDRNVHEEARAFLDHRASHSTLQQTTYGRDSACRAGHTVWHWYLPLLWDVIRKVSGITLSLRGCLQSHEEKGKKDESASRKKNTLT